MSRLGEPPSTTGRAGDAIWGAATPPESCAGGVGEASVGRRAELARCATLDGLLGCFLCRDRWVEDLKIRPGLARGGLLGNSLRRSEMIAHFSLPIAPQAGPHPMRAGQNVAWPGARLVPGG